MKVAETYEKISSWKKISNGVAQSALRSDEKMSKILILVFEIINSHSTTKTNIWNGFYCSFFAFLIIDVDYVLRHIFYSLAINSMTSFTFSYYEWNILHINWHFWKISQGKSLHDMIWYKYSNAGLTALLLLASLSL